MGKVIDLCEYPNDAAAQAAFVSSDAAYTADLLAGGTPSADTDSGAGYEAAEACDNNAGTFWASDASAFPHWWKYDFGTGKVISRITMDLTGCHSAGNYYVKDFKVQGSNNDSDWDDLHTGEHTNAAAKETFSFSKSVSYRYYRIYITSSWAGVNYAAIAEAEMMSIHLQCYSEDTIKEQGVYSLKGFALITESLNDTLTRTVSPTLNLSNIDTIKYDIRALRTGSHIKIGIHDSGGTTTEHTANVLVANTNQAETWDISGVANADKDAIDSIIITVVNADAINIFYIDNLFGDIDKVFSETITTSEVFGRGIGKNPSEVMTLSEVFGRAMTLQRWLETMTLSEPTFKKGVSKRFSEIATLSEPAFAKALTRNLSDTATLSEVFARAMTLQRWLETVTLSEVAQKAISFFISETVTLSEVMQKAIGKNPVDTVTLSEVYARIWALKRIYNDVATLSEPVFSKGLARLLDDIIVLSDEYFRWHGKGKADGVGAWTPVTKEERAWTPTEKETGDWQTK